MLRDVNATYTYMTFSSCLEQFHRLEIVQMVALENILVGLSYMALSLIFAFTNGIVSFVLIRHKEYHTTTYRIILIMLLGSIMQLMTHFAGGVITINNGDQSVYLERIAGAWMVSGWFVYLAASLALAVDRTLTFVKIFDTRMTEVVIWGFLVFSLLCGLVYLVCLLLPTFGFTYYTGKGYGTWYYDGQSDTKYLETLEMILDFSILISVLLLYFLVFVRIVLMRKSAQTGMSSSAVEIRLLSIAVISFLYECTFLMWFFWGSQLMTEGMVSSAIVTLLWIVDCGLFSLATIAINTSIRKKIARLCWRQKPVKIVGVVSIFHTTTPWSNR